MLKKSLLSLSGIIIFLSMFWRLGVPVAAQVPEASMMFLNPGDKRVSFRFDLANNLIIIPVIINNSDTLHFILDTGINNTIITELSMGDSLSLKYSRQTKMKGLGSGEPLDALISTENTFMIPGIIGNNQEMCVLMQDVFHLSSILGIRVHGLIGYKIFSQFIIHIDYVRKVITLYDPEHFRYKPGRDDKTLPLVISNMKPYVYGTVLNEKGREVTVKLLIDSGANHAIWLLPGTREGLAMPSRTVNMYLGSGLSGNINGRIGRLPSFRLGPFSFPQVIVAYPDTLSLQNIIWADGRNGSLGAEILRRFDVTLDYSNHRITLRPNKYFHAPFTVNRAGITISAPIPGTAYYLISDLRKNSSAVRAGLKRGDKLDKINGKQVSHMTMDDIYRIFEGKAGKRIKMVVFRHNLPFVTYFYLEDFI